MRTFFVLLGFVAVALFFANPERASAVTLGSAIAGEASQTAVTAAPMAAADQAEHCAHVPCTNSAHSHSSGPCAGHSFVAIGEGWVAPDFVSAGSIGLKNDRYVGRSLLPPVPPPLS